MQLVGLTIFAAYPFESQVYYLLSGFNYFNLEFFPNLYNWFVPPFQNEWAIPGYIFIYGDMDFLRMMGSILLFIVFCIIVLLVMKFLVDAKP